MAQQTYGFANNGSIPKTNSSSLYGGTGASVSIGGQPPKPTLPPTQGGVINLGGGSATDNSVKYGTHPGMFPSTPVKSITNNADGSSTTQFHKADTGTTTGSSSTPSTSQLTPEQLTANTNTNNANNYGTNPGPAGYSLNTQIPGVLSASQPTDLEASSRAAVTQAGQMSPQEEAANANVASANKELKAYQNVQTLSPYAEASNYTNGAPTPAQVQNIEQAPDLAGRAAGTNGLLGSLGNIYGTANVAGANAALQGTQTAAARAQTAANTNLNAAQNTANRGLSGATTVLGAVSPVTQFGQLTNPVTGNPVNGGNYTDNPQLQSAVQQAVQLVNNGAAQNDPAVQSLLSTFGLPGQQAFTNAMQQVSNGTYNPTSLNTQVQTNNAIGSKYQNQAADLSTSLTQFNNVAATATNFLSSNLGINPTDIPKINEQIGTYMKNVKNPAAVAQYNLIMNDTTALQGSILNSYGGSTPTANVKATLETDPNTLPVNQLQSWFSTLKQLGDIQLGAQQGTSNSAYHSSTPYSGAPTTANTSTTATPNATTAGLNTGNLAEAAGGAGINFGGEILNTIKSVGPEILGFITGLHF